MQTIIKRLVLGAVFALTLAAATPASAVILGFEAGLNDDGTLSIYNSSTLPGAQIVSLTLDFTPSSTFYNTAEASPGGTTWAPFSNLDGVSATLPDSGTTDGASTATFTFADFLPAEYSLLGFDLDSGSGDTGQVFGSGKTTITVTFSTNDVLYAYFNNDGVTINSVDYDNYASAHMTTTPLPSAALLIASGLLGLLGVRRMTR